ncbi:676_t:CDS:2 [Paraglomus occultum]|uniref:676_t:CDS:1 n=1 Tax=Paraglomus occultum TaxID=144539 RepID=A0A9N9A6U7_9GLOM|nr:676_t:CDS:2 [Paraglomus occultum]
MALKYELEQWATAVVAYDEDDFNKALEIFESIADSAKFHFNMGLIYATCGEHEEACGAYEQATKLDVYFAVAYFQKGVSHFLLGDFESALTSFNDALLYLRGNMLIDYEQLGLKFRLYSCEVLFNRGLCYLYLGQTEKGLDDFAYAAKEKQTEEHDVIDEAMVVQGQGFTVFSIPVGVIYRPPEGKLKNVKTKNYLGEPTLIAVVDPGDAFVGFTGAEQLKNQQMSTTAPITKERTDGRVDSFDGNGSRPGSPLDRPRSLSTNPRNPPFPAISTRPSIRRQQPQRKNTLPSVREAPSLAPNNGRNVGPPKVPPGDETGGTRPLRRPTDILVSNHYRSNTIDSGRPSPKLTPARQNSLRKVARNGSLRREPSPNTANAGLPSRRQDSLRRDRSPNPRVELPPSNDYPRPPYMQGKMPIQQQVDESNGVYPNAYQNLSPSNTEDFNQLYDFIMNNDNGYYMDGNKPDNNLPLLNGNSDNQGVRKIQSPPPDGQKAAGYLLSPRQEGMQGLELSPDDKRTYASILFNQDGDDAYQYGDEDDTQFVLLGSPNAKNGVNPQVTSGKKGLKKEDNFKIRIKCYHKDTRAFIVPNTITYEDLVRRIQEKFGNLSQFKLRYKDDDGTKVTLTDQEDLEMALSHAAASSDGIRKMELWINDD